MDTNSNYMMRLHVPTNDRNEKLSASSFWTKQSYGKHKV